MTYQLHHGDALEFMATLPDASVDALITDPPYGTTQLEWDKPVDWPAFWRETYRVCKPTAVQVVFSAQPFTTDLIASNRARFRYDLIWHKTVPVGFLDAKRRPLRVHEVICVFGESQGVYNPQMTEGAPYTAHRGSRASGIYGKQSHSHNDNPGTRYPRSVLEFSNGNGVAREFHPTQKPLPLMQWLVRTYTNPGDTVLDPFAGSGSTGVAALRESRHFIGCELDPTYHAIATKRLEAAAAQPRLLVAS